MNNMTTADPLPSAPVHTGHRCSRRGLRGFTLVEVMVSTFLFTLIGLSVAASLVENMQMSTRLRYRTQAVNVALNFLEQVRVMQYSSVKDLCTKAAINSSTYLRLIVQDSGAADYTAIASPSPTDTTPGYGVQEVPLGYQYYDMKINVVNGTVTNTAANTYSGTSGFAVENTATGTVTVRMPMKFWLTIKYNEIISSDPLVTAKGEAVEIVITYYWQDPTSSDWKAGTIRAAIVNPNAKKSNPTSLT